MTRGGREKAGKGRGLSLSVDIYIYISPQRKRENRELCFSPNLNCGVVSFFLFWGVLKNNNNILNYEDLIQFKQLAFE